MGKPLTMGAMLKCSMGMTPSPFTVADPLRPTVENRPAGVLTDNVPATNIMPFGMCQSLINPTVAAATSAALGVLTPMPCVPATTAPWMVTSMVVTIGNKPALLDSSKCMCNWGGMISVSMPAAMVTESK